MKIKRYLIGLCGLLLAACGQQEIARPWESGSNSGDLQLQLSTKGLMNRYVVTSKGTDVKTSEEQEIKTLHVFLFDQTGAYLQAKEANRYQNYITGGRTVINIDRQGWKDNGKAEHATVIVVANVEDGTFLYEQTTQPPTNIPDRDSLLRFIYRPLEDRLVKDLPESGMPMFACINDVDLTSSNSEQSIGFKICDRDYSSVHGGIFIQPAVSVDVKHCLAFRKVSVALIPVLLARLKIVAVLIKDKYLQRFDFLFFRSLYVGTLRRHVELVQYAFAAYPYGEILLRRTLVRHFILDT